MSILPSVCAQFSKGVFRPLHFVAHIFLGAFVHFLHLVLQILLKMLMRIWGRCSVHFCDASVFIFVPGSCSFLVRLFDQFVPSSSIQL